IVLPNRKAKLRLVDLDPRGAERIQQRQRLANGVAPAAVAQLHGDRVIGEAAQQPREVVACLGRILETWRELREQRAHFPCGRKWIDAGPKVVDVGLRDLREEVEQRSLRARRAL